MNTWRNHLEISRDQQNFTQKPGNIVKGHVCTTGARFRNLDRKTWARMKN